MQLGYREYDGNAADLRRARQLAAQVDLTHSSVSDARKSQPETELIWRESSSPAALPALAWPPHNRGASAPVDIATGRATQSWLAASDDEAARTSGGYWHAMQREEPVAPAASADYGDRLFAALEALTGVTICAGN